MSCCGNVLIFGEQIMRFFGNPLNGAFAFVDSVKQRVARPMAHLGRFGRSAMWCVRNWALTIVLLVVSYVGLIHYLPDAITTTTYDKVEIIEAQQNTANYTIKLQLNERNERNLPRVLEVQNRPQWSDFHFFPSNLQSQAATIAEHNRAVREGRSTEATVLVTVRLSGIGIGSAARSSNITQIDPLLWSPLYNIIGSLMVIGYWVILFVGLPKLVILGIAQQRRWPFYLGGGLLLAYVIDWVYI